MTYTPIRRYLRGPNLALIQDVQGNKSYIPHFDHQGTTQCLTDRETGAVTDRFACDAWGVPVKRTGVSINRQWYIGNSGYRSERETSVGYVRQRWLRCALGAWSSPDPLGLTVEVPQFYGYGLNSPVRFVDPTGEKCDPWSVSACTPDCRAGLARGKPGQGACPVPGSNAAKALQKLCNYDLGVALGLWPAQGRGVPGWPQATTNYCCRVVCGGTRPDWGIPDLVGGWMYVTGCTVFNPSFLSMHWIYQICIWEHEERRRKWCHDACTPDLGDDKAESNRILYCVRSYLRNVCGWQPSQLGGCHPV